MPAQITIVDLKEPETTLTVLQLGEILVPSEGLTDGEPVALRVSNTGDTNLREISIVLDGEGKDQVQLARDEDGSPGVWAAPGEPIIPVDFTVYRGEHFHFWARGIFHATDAEARLPFSVFVKATSTG